MVHTPSDKSDTDNISGIDYSGNSMIMERVILEGTRLGIHFHGCVEQPDQCSLTLIECEFRNTSRAVHASTSLFTEVNVMDSVFEDNGQEDRQGAVGLDLSFGLEGKVMVSGSSFKRNVRKED
ncbi:MAG: hypothetical protein MI748_01905 [Opitutales bacterium]|nr:hypothetical protein [Opitutales bacterium]